MSGIAEATVCVETLEKRLRHILQELTEKESESLLAELSSFNISIKSEPSTGLVMLRVKDCFGCIFNLGEALVTQAEIELNGVRGHATTLGESSCKAVLAASISAISQKVDVECNMLTEFDTILKECEERVGQLRKQEEALVAATKVDFESMAEER